MPKPNKKRFFKYIVFFLDNLQVIIENYNLLIKEQDTLLNKYSVVNSKLEKANKVRDVMLEVSHSTIEINDTEDLYRLILEKLISTIDDADKGSFIILTKDNIVEYKAAVGFDIDSLKRIRFKLEETFLWKKSHGNITKPCIIKDIRSFDNTILSSETYKTLEDIGALDIKTTLSTPIVIDNKLYGMINIDSLNIDAFNEDDLLVAEYFSNQIGIAIKNHELIEKIVYLSRYDTMTCAYNRCYFDELLDKFYKKALRYDEAFCLVLFDLNNLKKINDTYGHAIGDMVITKFAETINENIRESDLFARYGGDEFIGVFFNSTTLDLEKRLSEVIKYLNRSPIKIMDMEIFVSFSYGIVSFPDDSKYLNDLIKLADKRMYDYKAMTKSNSH
ncbi:sensor domain-containing diguanylate cyclase [Wukongibacter baidiensis]